MAGEQNVISVVIESVNKMSQDLARIEGDMRKLEGTTGTTEKTFKTTGQSTRGLMQTMSPLRSLLVQLTDTTGALGTAMFNLIRAGLNPMALAITGVVIGASTFISRWVEAKKATEEFNKSIEDSRRNLSLMNVGLRTLGDTTADLQLAIANMRAQQAQQMQALLDQLYSSQSRAKVPGQFLVEDALKFWFGVPTGEEAESELKDRIQFMGKVSDSMITALRKEFAFKDAEKRKQFLLQFVGADEDTLEAGSADAILAVEKLVQDMEEAARKSREKLIQTLALSTVGLDDISEIGDLGVIAQIEKIADDHAENMKKRAEATAKEMADSFVNDFLHVMEGGKFSIENFFADLGRTVVAQFMRAAIAEMLVNPILDMLKSGTNVGGGGGGLWGLLKSLFGASGGGVPVIGGEYGRGGYLPGNFVPVGELRKFAAGGVARGPTLGVIGEEGPEIVARMKPARPGDMGGGDIRQNIYLVDNRPPRIGPKDVVLYIEQDMRSGGKTAGAVQNVIKRT